MPIFISLYLIPYTLYRVIFLTGSAPKSSKCWGWQNPNQKSESGPIQKQDMKFYTGSTQQVAEPVKKHPVQLLIRFWRMVDLVDKLQKEKRQERGVMTMEWVLCDDDWCRRYFLSFFCSFFAEDWQHLEKRDSGQGMRYCWCTPYIFRMYWKIY